MANEKVSILIIDDDEVIAQSTAEFFNMFEVNTAYVTSYDEAVKFLDTHLVSLLLLDINLGEKSGFDLCRKVRENYDMPILFISARTSDDDVLIALNIGGDDYIKKPFTLSILLAKVKTILARYEKAKEAALASQNNMKNTGNAPGLSDNQGIIGTAGSSNSTGIPDSAGSSNTAGNSNSAGISGNAGYSNNTGTSTGTGNLGTAASPIIKLTKTISLDTAARKLKSGNEQISLKAMEYKLLKYLIDNCGRVVTKDELLKDVWDDEFIGEGTLAVHIRHLREKIEKDPKQPELIKTIWGVGYMVETYEELL